VWETRAPADLAGDTASNVTHVLEDLLKGMDVLEYVLGAL